MQGKARLKPCTQILTYDDVKVLLGQVGETALNGHAASAEALPDKRPISTISSGRYRSTYINDAFDTGVYHETKH